MILHLGAYSPAIPVENDEVRVLPRHVAINTVARDFISHLRMTLDFMAVQATFGKHSRVLLHRMNIVASQTSHCR